MIDTGISRLLWAAAKKGAHVHHSAQSMFYLHIQLYFKSVIEKQFCNIQYSLQDYHVLWGGQQLWESSFFINMFFQP